MSRSKKKIHYKKDSGTTPEIRRLTRHRMKSPKYADTKYSFVVDNWDFNDHVLREFEYEPGIREIREKYERERRRVEENRHPLCYRLGKAAALKKLERTEKRELFQYLKRLRKK